MLKLGFTSQDVEHLREHLTRVVTDSGMFRDDPRYASIRDVGVHCDWRPRSQCRVQVNRIDWAPLDHDIDIDSDALQSMLDDATKDCQR